MTTLTKCKEAAKKLNSNKSLDFVIVHTPGHCDETKVGTDRGYTILPLDEVWNFGAEIDRYFTLGGTPLDTELLKARTAAPCA
jgi:hypothetical protein